MTPLDIAYRYGRAPGAREMQALSALTEVYGVRKLRFDEAAKAVHVEFDASRLSEDSIAALLRNTGLDLKEKLALA
jgi:hypothetical protein